MFEYEFMRLAFAAAACVALIAGPIGYFLVLRGQSFAGHALAHVGFAGATGAVLLGLPPISGMMALTVMAGLGMGLIGEKLPSRDVAIGLVLAASLGLGLLFLHFFKSSATQATALLFGNILAISPSLLKILGALSVVCLFTLGLLARPLLFASLQPELAAAKGVNVKWLGMLFLGLVALATAAASQILGVLLVFALMVGPGATALRFSLSPMKGLALAATLALAESWGGLMLAYASDWPVSFWITTLSLLAFAIAGFLPRSSAH